MSDHAAKFVFRHVVLGGAMLAMVVSAPAAQAQEQAQAPEDDSGLRSNCVGDYFRFCAAYVPGSTAIRQCFSRNLPQLTPACQGAIRAFDNRAGKGRG